MVLQCQWSDDEWGQLIPIPQLRVTNDYSSRGQAGRVWTWVTLMKRVHEPKVLVILLCSLLWHNSWRSRGSCEFVWKYLGRQSLLTSSEAPRRRHHADKWRNLLNEWGSTLHHFATHSLSLLVVWVYYIIFRMFTLTVCRAVQAVYLSLLLEHVDAFYH